LAVALTVPIAVVIAAAARRFFPVRELFENNCLYADGGFPVWGKIHRYGEKFSPRTGTLHCKVL
jgi:hypothetical protein